MPRASHQLALPFGSREVAATPRQASTWWPYSWMSVCWMSAVRPAGTVIRASSPRR